MFVGTDPEGEALEEDNVLEWLADVEGRGKRVIGDRLRPVDDATTVRVRNGKLLVTDGPFTEAKDWIVGFDISTATTWTRLSRSPRRTRWPGQAGLSCVRSGRSQTDRSRCTPTSDVPHRTPGCGRRSRPRSRTSVWRSWRR